MKEPVTIRFYGGGVNPESVDAREVATLIQQFCDSARALAPAAADKGDEGATFNLFQIKDESLGLKFLATAAAVAAHLGFCSAISKGDINSLPPKSQEFAQSVRRFTVEHRCQASFYRAGDVGNPDIVITPQTELNQEFHSPLNGRVLLYGRLERVGGKEPRAVLVGPDSERRYYCRITEAQARELGARVYEVVGLDCEADWSWLGQQGTDLKVREILPYRQTAAKSAIEALRAAIRSPLQFGDAWNDDDEETVTP